MKNRKKWKKNYWFAAAFLLINLLAVFILSQRENRYISQTLTAHVENSREKTEEVMQNYTHSFQLFAQMLSREIENNPDPDEIWDYLKSIDSPMLDIEGDTFDGLYMYYRGRYLYSWDTPYSQYESTGYAAKERPWYINAEAGQGQIVFTPPYMSYANHYILSTISQLQPDGETVFAYDIKMGNIQNLVSSLEVYPDEQIMIFDKKGTIIGSSNEMYLGGILSESSKDAENALKKARTALKNPGDSSDEQIEKLQEQVESAEVFYQFRKEFDDGFTRLLEQPKKTVSFKLGSQTYYGCLLQDSEYSYLTLVPFFTMMKSTVQVWLLPLLALELLLIYIFSRISKEQRNRELHAAYVELGQTQKRLEIALSAAQKAAAIDDLTGMMNFKSFRRSVTEMLENMGPDESGILIMIDGDHFKAVNDNYGHNVGDEVIKLTAQMIIGRIRTIDLASRLHGDEFAVFVAKTADYNVGRRIIEDINNTLAEEAAKRKMPAITLSSGAVIARNGDNYASLAKAADAALYEAKVTHDGQFAGAPVK